MLNQFDSVPIQDKNVKAVHSCAQFNFEGFASTSSYCALRLLQLRDGRRVVVCSQPSGRYFGTSVTNAVEIISSELRQTSFKDWARWGDSEVWYEHYPVGTAILEGNYTLMRVSMDGASPSWGSSTRWHRAAGNLGIEPKTLAQGFEDELAIP